jgi:hypothetical protein
MCVGLSWYVLASTNPAQWVGSKFCAVVRVDIWWKDGGCGISYKLFCGRYCNAIMNDAEDKPGAGAVVEAKVVVLLGRQADEQATLVVWGNIGELPLL